MAAVARIEIQIDEKGLVTALNQVTGRVSQIQPALEKAGKSGNVVFTRMAGDTQRAHDAAALFGRYLGTELPRQLQNFLARSQTIGPVLSAMFNVAVIGGFGLALIGVAGKIADLVQQIEDWTSTDLQNVEAQKQINTSLADQAKQLRELRDQYKLIGLEGLPLLGAKQSEVNEKLKEAKDHLAAVAKEMREFKPPDISFWAQTERILGSVSGLPGFGIAAAKTARELANHGTEIQNALMAASAAVQYWTEMQKNAAKELSTGQSKKAWDDYVQQMQAIEEVNKKMAALFGGFIAPGIEAKLKQDAGIVKSKEMTDELEAWRIKKVAQAGIETQKIEQETALAILPPWERSYAQIALESQQRSEEIHRQLDGVLGAEKYEAQQIAAVQIQTFGRMRDQLAGDLESAFDDIVSGRLKDRVLKMFKDMVFQMLATWMLGMRGMQGSMAGGFGMPGMMGGGNLLGQLLGIGGAGGPLGLAGMIGPGGTAPWARNFLGGGLPLTLGGAWQSAPLSTTLPAGATAGITGGLGATAIAGLNLAKLFPHGLKIGGMALSGTALAAIGATLGVTGFMSLLQGGHAVSGTLSTIGGAALTGFAIAGPFGAAIGAIVGGIASIFGALFGSSNLRKKRDALTDSLKRDLKNLQDAYDLHQLDYNSAIAQAESLRAQYFQAQEKLKSGGWDVQGRVTGPVNAMENQIKLEEAERQRRLAISFGAPMFRQGGYVSSGLAAGGPLMAPSWAPRYASGGAVPAILHAGEYVMRPEAVQRIGKGNLDTMNSGAGGGEVHLHIDIKALDSRSVRDWLRESGVKDISEALRRARREGRWIM